MKKLYSIFALSLVSLQLTAQTNFDYTGTGIELYAPLVNFRASIIANISPTANPNEYRSGVIGYGTNSSQGNFGIIGTTRLNTIGLQPSGLGYIGVFGDNYYNNLTTSAPVTGGWFIANNSGVGNVIGSQNDATKNSAGGTATGTFANATGYNNTTKVTGVNSTATYSFTDQVANFVIGVRGETNVGGHTTVANQGLVTNPGGYFVSNDGQGVYGTSTGNYQIGSLAYSQGVTGYSDQNVAINSGVVGVASGSGDGAAGNHKYGVWGDVKGAAVTGYSAGVYGTDGIAAANTYAGYFSGKVYVDGNFTATGVKAFTIDHPLDPEHKVLRHAAIESNEVLNQYSGNISTDAKGFATVILPNYFETLNKDFRYQLTVIGSFAQAIIKQKIADNQFVIQTNQPNIEVSWQVTGVRNDKVMQAIPFESESWKGSDLQGKYLSPGAYKKAP